MLDKVPIVAITGPTGSGKTKLSVEIAKLFNGEVISIDSIQIYKDAKIMSGAATDDEMQNVPHHFIGCLEPDAEVMGFVPATIHAIRSIHARGRLPILCGGSLSLTGPALFNPFISRQNLFVIILNGKPSNLGKLSDARIEMMIEEGMEAEVQHLHAMETDHDVSTDQICQTGVWKAIGYPELRPSCIISDVTDKEIAFRQGIELMKLNTKKYAAMQLAHLSSKLIPALVRQQTYFCNFIVEDKESFPHRVQTPALEACRAWLEATRPTVNVQLRATKRMEQRATTLPIAIDSV